MEKCKELAEFFSVIVSLLFTLNTTLVAGGESQSCSKTNPSKMFGKIPGRHQRWIYF